MKELKPYVIENEDNIIIVGTDNIQEAENALRLAEIDWYGENHEEEPMKIEDFYPHQIYFGKGNDVSGFDGEEMYYFGDSPKEFLKGRYVTTNGFVCYL